MPAKLLDAQQRDLRYPVGSRFRNARRRGRDGPSTQSAAQSAIWLFLATRAFSASGIVPIALTTVSCRPELSQTRVVVVVVSTVGLWRFRCGIGTVTRRPACSSPC